MDDGVTPRVIDIVSRIAGPQRTPSTITRDTRLWQGGFWLDSIELLEVLLACDAAFATGEDGSLGLTADALATVDALATAIRQKLAR